MSLAVLIFISLLCVNIACAALAYFRHEPWWILLAVPGFATVIFFGDRYEKATEVRRTVAVGSIEIKNDRAICIIDIPGYLTPQVVDATSIFKRNFKGGEKINAVSVESTGLFRFPATIRYEIRKQ